MPSFKKDPDAVLDYSADWSAWLGSDTITNSEWFVAGPALPGSAALELDPGHAPTIEGKVTRCWVRGGTVGQGYQLTNRIVTAGGRTDDRTLQLVVQSR